MVYVHCLPPIEGPRSSVLILGSMPGKASLEARQYYAHPRNLFWQILTDFIGVAADAAYRVRVQALRRHDIALWDVLASCVRESSLDADIDAASLTANDFAAFYRAHPHIGRVFFNGAKAEECYRKYVLPSLGGGFMSLRYQRLPSTSPANAALSAAQKRQAWMALA
jgi:TDG/mug DNA glycosylase family protein